MPPKKCLVYMSAFGKPYQWLAQMLVQSIRVFGYDGDIVVLTDANCVINGARVENIIDGVREQWISNKLSDRALLRNRCGSDRYDYIAARMYIDKFIDVSPYTNFMFLDTDVIATGDIRPIFDLSQDGVLCVARHGLKLWTGCFEFSQFLSEDDRKFAKSHSKSNAGMLCFSSQIASSFLSMWRELWEKYMYSDFKCYRKYSLLDETIMNFMFAKRDFKFIRTEVWGFYDRKQMSNRILHHFAGPKDEGFHNLRTIYESSIAPMAEREGMKRVPQLEAYDPQTGIG